MIKMSNLISLIAVSLLSFQITTCVRAEYTWNRDYQSYWSLADRSSTIEAKHKHLSVFAAKLRALNLEDKHSALVFKTPSNNFGNNLQALENLIERLEEIKDMDPQSFEYQTAIQQITKQGQVMAGPMLFVLHGTYMMHDWSIFCYCPVGPITSILLIIIFLISGLVYLISISPTTDCPHD